MSLRKKIIISVVVIFIIIFFIVHIVAGGSIGIRPATHGCTGLKMSSKTVLKFLPKGDVEFLMPFHFRYFVSEDYYKNSYSFCLGQDVWMGE